jgi:hypothetical protein
MLWMETVIHIALEVVSAMKPWASAHEDFPAKPLWAVVASGSTVIRSGVIVTIGTIRGYADLDADLTFCFGSGSRETDSSNSS